MRISIYFAMIFAVSPASAQTSIASACIINAGQQLYPQAVVTAAEFKPSDKTKIAAAVVAGLYDGREASTILDTLGLLDGKTRETIRSQFNSGDFSGGQATVARVLAEKASEAGTVVLSVTAFTQAVKYQSDCISVGGYIKAQKPVLQ